MNFYFLIKNVGIPPVHLAKAVTTPKKYQLDAVPVNQRAFF